MGMEYSTSVESILNKILFLRGERVLLVRDLAALYGVKTKVLKQAVRKNIKRFPEDFMFERVKEENLSLRSQNATLKRESFKVLAIGGAKEETRTWESKSGATHIQTGSTSC